MKIGKCDVEMCTHAAGRFTIWGEYGHQSINIHFFPKKKHREWGYSEEWHDGAMYYIGLGPLLLICAELDFHHIKESIKEMLKKEK
jgi:hypothetical protein